MIVWFLMRQCEAMGRRYGYDIGYLKYLANTDRSAFSKFCLATFLSFHRRGVPDEAWYAAKITAARSEDCGPCTQLVADMALDDGVPTEIVRAILSDDVEAMGQKAALGWGLARGICERNDAMLDDAIREITQRWGAQAHSCLVAAIVGVRLYPTMKRGLGFAKACQMVKVGDRMVAASPPPAGAGREKRSPAT